MTKTLTEAQITTAKARSKLEFGVHWRRLDAEAHLGYRKGKRSGVSFVRWRNRYDGANYKQAPTGVANDINDKLAEGTLTFEQRSHKRGNTSPDPERKRRRQLFPWSRGKAKMQSSWDDREQELSIQHMTHHAGLASATR